jgi:hypothetical protein
MIPIGERQLELLIVAMVCMWWENGDDRRLTIMWVLVGMRAWIESKEPKCCSW